MDDNEWLTIRFEENRSRLRAVAYRMLGSLSEADDALQESWIRLHRADTNDVENLDGWLTTVVARVCLNSLRSRKRRKKLYEQAEVEASIQEHSPSPEDEAVMADSVGLALLVVLDTLSPAERIAFVMHDMFAVPFEELAPMLDRSPSATRQLASRARRRVHGRSSRTPSDFARQREMVDAFLAAAQHGDFEALLLVLDPDITLRVDALLMPTGTSLEIHGSRTVAGQAVAYSRRASFTRAALVNGDVGYVVAPFGKLQMVAVFRFDMDRQVIADMELIADPLKIRRLELSNL
jgi:RNA polymerase sigma-70 factor, ECF subfamily